MQAPQARRIGLTEAAESIGVSKRTIRRRIADGSLPAYRIGPRLIKVDRTAVEALAKRIPTGGEAA